MSILYLPCHIDIKQHEVLFARVIYTYKTVKNIDSGIIIMYNVQVHDPMGCTPAIDEVTNG